MGPLLLMDDLVLRPGPDFRLGPVRLEVRAGERVGLVGPSGGGKTTLLRAVSGIGPSPDAGDVLVAGRSVQTLERRARARAVGMLQQDHDLVLQLRVRHNIQAGLLGRWSFLRALVALVGPVESPEARRAAERVGLGPRFDSRTADLSGGERQRVAIARLLVQNPRLMLADEPVASLDPHLASEVLEIFTRLARDEGRALLCSLHQPRLALRFFDRIVGIREGRIVLDRPSSQVQDGELDTLYAPGRRVPATTRA